jgi:hypothetical protein
MNGFKNYNRDIANRLFLEERVKYCQRISRAAPPLIARSFQGLGRMMLRAPTLNSETGKHLSIFPRHDTVSSRVQWRARITIARVLLSQILIYKSSNSFPLIWAC